VSTNPEPIVRAYVALTPADLRNLAGLASRRFQRMFLIVGVPLAGAGLLALADGDLGPFVAGLVMIWLGLSLLVTGLLLPWRVRRRLPAAVREPRWYEIDASGIQVSGAETAARYSWAVFRRAALTRHFLVLSREKGVPGVLVPRSGFTPEEEGRLLAFLADRGLLSRPPT
jgi:hypothetical protein